MREGGVDMWVPWDLPLIPRRAAITATPLSCLVAFPLPSPYRALPPSFHPPQTSSPKVEVNSGGRVFFCFFSPAAAGQHEGLAVLKFGPSRLLMQAEQ